MSDPTPDPFVWLDPEQLHEHLLLEGFRAADAARAAGASEADAIAAAREAIHSLAWERSQADVAAYLAGERAELEARRGGA